MRLNTKDQPFAKRSLGQNFLVDPEIVRRIIAAFGAGRDDVVLEIGPGRGALTEGLLETAGKLFVLEFDDALARSLEDRFGSRDNFTLVKGDALQLDFSSISPGHPIRLISNLPYNISTAILQRLFEHTTALSDCVLMFQREVVDRITAAPGTKDRGYLTVLTELYFEVEKLFDVPPNAFRPAPKVVSSVVRLKPKRRPDLDPQAFRLLVSTAFLQKRKTLSNNLKQMFPSITAAFVSAEIDRGRRAESLTLDEWVRLHRALS